MVREAGYRSVRTVELMSLKMPHRRNGVAVLPTTIQAKPGAVSEVARNSLKRLRPANFVRYLLFQKPDWVATAEALLEHVLSRGGVFHLWGHSWEIEERNQWSRLEEVLRMLGGLHGTAEFLTNAQVPAQAAGIPGRCSTSRESITKNCSSSASASNSVKKPRTSKSTSFSPLFRIMTRRSTTGCWCRTRALSPACHDEDTTT